MMASNVYLLTWGDYFSIPVKIFINVRLNNLKGFIQKPFQFNYLPILSFIL